MFKISKRKKLHFYFVIIPAFSTNCTLAQILECHHLSAVFFSRWSHVTQSCMPLLGPAMSYSL